MTARMRVVADLLNDRVLPFFEERAIPLLRVLTDCGTEYCGQRLHYQYELYLAVENIDHSRTKARHPQTNGICERFHRTIQEEFYATAFRKKLYRSLEVAAIRSGSVALYQYNRTRPHSGKYCYGKTPMQTFLDSLPLAREKMLDSFAERSAGAEAEPRTAQRRRRRVPGDSPLDLNQSVRSSMSYYKSYFLVRKYLGG